MGDCLRTDMKYQIISEATIQPVTLTEARDHLRVVPFGYPSAHPDDTYIESAIAAARQWVEEYIERPLVSKTIEYYVSQFEQSFDLPTLPIQDVQSIKYLADDNTIKTVAIDVYKLKTYSDSAKIILAYGKSFPTDVINEENSITLTVTAGYTVGESPNTYPLPAPIKAAILLIIGNLYENRQQDVLGNTRISFNSLPLGVYNLLQPYRMGLGL